MKELFTSIPCLSPSQVKDYIDDRLDKAKRFEVENHLLDCELCTAAIEGFSESYDFKVDQELEQLENLFDPAQKAKEAQLKPLRNNYSFINRIAAAAAIILLPLAAWFYWSAQSNDRLFSQYFESYESDYLAMRSAEETANPLLTKAMEVYREKEFLSSIPLFESYLEQVPENTIAAFHTGLACLEAGQNSKAIQYLQTVRLNDEEYYEDASWYLALAYLEMDRKEEALAVLKDLTKISNGYYQKEVGQLIEQLNDPS